ncbi:MAG: hypothetical protein ABSE49_33895 [Polyangiaceae bacterium]
MRLLHLLVVSLPLAALGACSSNFGAGQGTGDASVDGTGGSDASPDQVIIVVPGADGGKDATVAEADTGPDSSSGETGSASIVSCALVTADQHMLTADGGAIAADSLTVYSASVPNVLALAETSAAPSLAYWFRSDRPSNAPQVVSLGDDAGPASLVSSVRSVDGEGTYVLAGASDGKTVLWDWLDSSGGIGGGPVVGGGLPSSEPAQMTATSQGLFYILESSGSQGTYVDFEVPPALPSVIVANQVTTGAANFNDGKHLYRLSDDSVSVLYDDEDGTMHQNRYAPSSTTMTSTRQYFTGVMLPFDFSADGANVDVGAIVMTPDAGNGYGLVTGVVPESQLFTFDPATALQPVPPSVMPTAQSCVAAYPGKFLVLTPTTSGMTLAVIDAATGTVSYSLSGASLLLPGDAAIVNCAVATANVTSSTLSFDVVWTENTGTGLQNLFFAPLQCTLQ